MTNTNTGHAPSAAAPKRGKKRLSSYTVKKKIGGFFISLLRYALIISLSYMILYPLLQMLSLVIKHPTDLGSTTSIWVPEVLDFTHIRLAWMFMDYFKSFALSFTSSTIIALLQMLNAAFAGYAFARLKFRGSGIIFILMLVTIIIPPTSLMLPQYVMFKNFDIFGIITLIKGESLNMIGSPASMYVLAAFGQGIKAGLFVYIFRQFFRGLPKELEEAAYVDGAGFLRTFFRIVLPSAKPGFLTVGVLSFVWNWNDTYIKGIFDDRGQYLPNVALRLATNAAGGESNIQSTIERFRTAGKIPEDITILAGPNPLYDNAILQAAQLLVIAPLIIFFAIIQKQFIEGVERSGIVG